MLSVLGNQAALRRQTASPIERDLATALLPPIVTSGAGRALDTREREQFEPRVGVDLSRVRTHTDATANGAAEMLGARAFARGQDVFFAAGRGPSDRALLGHELAHVAQQATGRAHVQARSALEIEAKSVAAGGALSPAPRVTGTPRPAIQLDAETDLDAELHHRLRADDSEGIARQRERLREICSAATPDEARRLAPRLSPDVPAVVRRRDALAEQFHSTLHVAVQQELFRLLLVRAATAPEPAPPEPAPPPPAPPAPAGPVVNLPVARTGPIGFEMEPGSTSALMQIRDPNPQEDASYIERLPMAQAYSIAFGYFVLFAAPDGNLQEITVPYAAADLVIEGVDDVGHGRVFDNSDDALAAVSAAGGPIDGARRRIAYYRLLGAIVPTLFCPGTTPRIVAGWRELHRRVAEMAGGFSDALRTYTIQRIVGAAGGLLGQRVIRFSETAPVTMREAVRRSPFVRRIVEATVEPQELPPPNRQWGAPLRGEAHEAPARPAQPPPAPAPAQPAAPPQPEQPPLTVRVVRAPQPVQQPVPPRTASEEEVEPLPQPPAQSPPQAEAQVAEGGGVVGPRPQQRRGLRAAEQPPGGVSGPLPGEVQRVRFSVSAAHQWVQQRIRAPGFSGDLQTIYVIRGTANGTTRVLKVGLAENSIQHNRLANYLHLPQHPDVVSRGIQIDIEVIVVRRVPPLSRVELTRMETDLRRRFLAAGETLPWDHRGNESQGSIVPSPSEAPRARLDDAWRWTRTDIAVGAPVPNAAMFDRLRARYSPSQLLQYLERERLTDSRVTEIEAEAGRQPNDPPLHRNTIISSWIPFLRRATAN